MISGRKANLVGDGGNHYGDPLGRQSSVLSVPELKLGVYQKKGPPASIGYVRHVAFRSRACSGEASGLNRLRSTCRLMESRLLGRGLRPQSATFDMSPSGVAPARKGPPASIGYVRHVDMSLSGVAPAREGPPASIGFVRHIALRSVDRGLSRSLSGLPGRGRRPCVVVSPELQLGDEGMSVPPCRAPEGRDCSARLSVSMSVSGQKNRFFNYFFVYLDESLLNLW